MIVEKSSPGLRGWFPIADHVLAEGSLGNADAQFLKFAMASRCSPKRVLSTQFSDEFSRVLGEGGPSSSSVADLPCPVPAESLAVPSDHSIGLNDDQRRAPTPPDFGQPNPQTSINAFEFGFRVLPVKDCELMSQR